MGDQSFISEDIHQRYIEVLKPLVGENENEEQSIEYRYHLKMLQDFDRRLRQVEMHFRDLYQRVIELEQVF